MLQTGPKLVKIENKTVVDQNGELKHAKVDANICMCVLGAFVRACMHKIVAGGPQHDC